MPAKEGAILVMEDDENDALLLKRALKKIGVTRPVHIVPDGEEGIAYLSGSGKYEDREKFPLPDLIITDLKMPRKSGLEVLKWLGENPQFRLIPTLVFSSSGNQSDVTRAYGFGANSYIVKPGDFQNLEQLAKLIHDYWKACETPKPTS